MRQQDTAFWEWKDGWGELDGERKGREKSFPVFFTLSSSLFPFVSQDQIDETTIENALKNQRFPHKYDDNIATRVRCVK